MTRLSIFFGSCTSAILSLSIFVSVTTYADSNSPTKTTPMITIKNTCPFTGNTENMLIQSKDCWSIYTKLARIPLGDIRSFQKGLKMGCEYPTTYGNGAGSFTISFKNTTNDLACVLSQGDNNSCYKPVVTMTTQDQGCSF